MGRAAGVLRFGGAHGARGMGKREEGMLEHDGPSLFRLIPRARTMRKNPTRSEALLWRRVCGRQLGVRVRRQHPMHPYIADFYVAAYKLVVEVDGGVHRTAEARARDAHRD